MKKIILVLLGLPAACGELDKQTLKQWKSASDSARSKVVAEYFAENADHVKNCITRMSALPDTEKLSVMDAGGACLTGLRIREKNAARNAKK